MRTQHSSDLLSDYPDIYKNLSELINSGEFPCLFAISSLNKNKMKAVVFTKKENQWSIISSDLISLRDELAATKDELRKSIATYIAVFEYEKTKKVDDSVFLMEFLNNLHKNDTVKWPDNKSQDPNDIDFEFFFGGKSWFPVILSPWHKSPIRRSPYLMVAIQPGDVFEYNKSARCHYYDNMRKSIHKRIFNFYNGDLPGYLSPVSSGKNVWQYIGFDESIENPNFLFEKIQKD